MVKNSFNYIIGTDSGYAESILEETASLFALCSHLYQYICTLEWNGKWMESAGEKMHEAQLAMGLGNILEMKWILMILLITLLMPIWF